MHQILTHTDCQKALNLPGLAEPTIDANPGSGPNIFT
jgi:hypothetical protein